MALIDKKELFRGRLIRINRGRSDKTEKELVQISLFNGATKEMKGIFIGEGRSEELALELEAAARAMRAPPADKAAAAAPPAEVDADLYHADDDFD